MNPALLLWAGLTFGALSAPFQCASDPDPNRRLEDTPSEALWMLAERFEADGDAAAQRTTLEQLVERYPTSREAERARRVLDGEEDPSAEPDGDPEPEPDE